MEIKEFHTMRQLEDRYWWFVVKRAFIKKTLALIKLPQKSQILDIGCGTGKNLTLLSTYGQTYGIDPSKLAIQYCHKRQLKNLKIGYIDKLPYQNNYFDLVTLFDVLYHQSVKNDQQALKEIYRILKPKGYLLLTDVAYQFLWSPHDVAYQAKKRYLKKELVSELTLAGFKIKKSSYYFLTTFPILIITRLFKKLIYQDKSSSDVKPMPNLLNQLLILLYQLEIKLYQYISLPVGSSIIILAQKK